MAVGGLNFRLYVVILSSRARIKPVIVTKSAVSFR